MFVSKILRQATRKQSMPALVEILSPMMRQLYILLLMTLTLFQMACVRQPIMIDRVVVQNATTELVTDVEVRHEPTMRFGAVNAILPGQELDISFPVQPMRAQQAAVSWLDASGRGHSAKLSLPYDLRMVETGVTASLVYVIRANGEVTVNLIPPH